MNGDLISREYIKLFTCEYEKFVENSVKVVKAVPIEAIENAPAVEEMEPPFITECRNSAIERNLPLYFVYYEETGVFEAYVTKTKELFEKRHCVKHLQNYEFHNLAMQYLDDYSDWIIRADMRGKE